MAEKQSLNQLMQKAQEMQQKMQEIQQEISKMEVLGHAGGGLVKVHMNGQHHAKKAHIDTSLLKEDKAILEDLIVAAINDAVSKIETGTKDKMMSLTNIKLPEGFELPA